MEIFKHKSALKTIFIFCFFVLTFSLSVDRLQATDSCSAGAICSDTGSSCHYCSSTNFNPSPGYYKGGALTIACSLSSPISCWIDAACWKSNQSPYGSAIFGTVTTAVKPTLISGADCCTDSNCPSGYTCSSNQCVFNCSETDGGNKPFVGGNTTYSPSQPAAYDHCIGNELTEYYCNGGSLGTSVKDCSDYDSLATCSGNKCVMPSNCTDSDGGKNYGTKGRATGVMCDEGVCAPNYFRNDYCENNYILNEAYCNGIYVEPPDPDDNFLYDCRDLGRVCSDGACVAGAGSCTKQSDCSTGQLCIYGKCTACTDSDGGENYTTRGTVTAGSYTSTDICEDATTLIEETCSGSVSYACPVGFGNGACVDGKCVNPTVCTANTCRSACSDVGGTWLDSDKFLGGTWKNCCGDVTDEKAVYTLSSYIGSNGESIDCPGSPYKICACNNPPQCVTCDGVVDSIGLRDPTWECWKLGCYNGSWSQKLCPDGQTCVDHECGASVNQLPTASITTPAINQAILTGGSVTFTGTGTDVDGTITAYEWNSGSCSAATHLSTSSSFSGSFPTTGTYTVYLRVRDDDGSWSTNCPSRIITVSPPGVSTLISNPNPIQVCDGSGTGITTLTWSAPGVTNTAIRVGSATGTIFTSGGTTGSETTGDWVTDGMQFFLVDNSAKASFTTSFLATSTVNLTDVGCSSAEEDCGFRMFSGSTIYKAACEPVGSTTSPLRIGNAGVVRGIILVDTTDSNASPVRIKTAAGIKAIKKL